MHRVVVVGGGPAGMMAAGQCAREGGRVTLLERNESLGKKLLITGKGRCNFTNTASLQEFMENMPGNGSFLFSALHAFGSQDLQTFFRGLGVPVTRERGGRVFPQSGRAGDILKALEEFLGTGVEVLPRQRVVDIGVKEKRVTGVTTEEGKEYRADRVIVATGGASYPGTGSTGDGYGLAGKLGHTVSPLLPGLVPMVLRETWVKDLEGLTLKNVELSHSTEEGREEGEFGDMLFTRTGISGPIVLSLSRRLLPLISRGKKGVCFSLNLKPALTAETLLKRVQRDLDARSKKEFRNCLDGLLPRRMIPVIVSLSGINPGKRGAHITREERHRLVETLQNLVLTLERLGPLEEAIVTVGGVCVREVHPGTMESRKIRGLHFCGEVLDVDGYTGGYNLQAAFSTGCVAGIKAAQA